VPGYSASPAAGDHGDGQAFDQKLAQRAQEPTTRARISAGVRKLTKKKS
jgi:hypothetical protein